MQRIENEVTAFKPAQERQAGNVRQAMLSKHHNPSVRHNWRLVKLLQLRHMRFEIGVTTNE